MTVTAMFAGACDDCDSRIRVGQSIRSNEDRT